MRITVESIKQRAQEMQEKRLENFLAVGRAFSGGKAKDDEALGGVKRFQRNWLKSGVAEICTTTTFKKGELSITSPKNMFTIVGGIILDVSTDEAEGLDHRVLAQMFENLTVEIKRNSQDSVVNSFRAYCPGISQVQGQQSASFPVLAGPAIPPGDFLLNQGNDFENPIDFLNPGESLELIIEGLTGITAAASHSAKINVVASAFCLMGAKG